MSAPKKFKSALKKLCDRAKSALNSQARISSPDYSDIQIPCPCVSLGPDT